MLTQIKVDANGNPTQIGQEALEARLLDPEHGLQAYIEEHGHLVVDNFTVNGKTTPQAGVGVVPEIPATETQAKPDEERDETFEP